MSEPTNTTSSPTTEVKPPEIDPFVKSLTDSFDKILEPNKKEDIVLPIVPISLADANELAIAAAKKPKEEVETEKPETVKPTETAPVPETKPTVRKKVPQPTIVTEVVAPTPAPAKLEPKPEDTTKPAFDEEYVKTLTPEQQDEVALARFAESKGKTGIATQFVDYFKKVDKYLAENPDATPDSEEFTKYLKDNRPKWSEADRRKVERQMVTEEAVKAAKAELEPVIQEDRRKLREMETRPIIDQSIAELEESITAKPEGDLQQVDKAALDLIKEKGYEAAVEEFPVEAPIIQGTINATRRWMELSRGLKLVDLNDPTDAWLVQFISTEGKKLAAGPKELQVIDGRQFLPLDQFMDISRKNPQEAAKHWTFSDDMIKDMLANRAVLHINNEIKKLERSGFKREAKKVSTTPGTQQTTTTTTVPPKVEQTTGSTRAVSKSLPGAGDTAVTPSEADKFIKSLGVPWK
jgi:hypothetical protein